MDPAKVSAVADWAMPRSRKVVQRFLGFSNFYCKVIRNYSSIAAPLHSLISPSQSFLWSTDPQEELHLSTSVNSSRLVPAVCC